MALTTVFLDFGGTLIDQPLFLRAANGAAVDALLDLCRKAGECDALSIRGEYDVMRRVVAEGRDPATTTVGDVMSSPVQHCAPETTLEECRAVMTNRRIRHLPVFDREGLCGIITSGDILAFELAEQRDTIEYLNAYVTEQR